MPNSLPVKALVAPIIVFGGLLIADTLVQPQSDPKPSQAPQPLYAPDTPSGTALDCYPQERSGVGMLSTRALYDTQNFVDMCSDDFGGDSFRHYMAAQGHTITIETAEQPAETIQVITENGVKIRRAPTTIDLPHGRNTIMRNINGDPIHWLRTGQYYTPSNVQILDTWMQDNTLHALLFDVIHNQALDSIEFVAREQRIGDKVLAFGKPHTPLGISF